MSEASASSYEPNRQRLNNRRFRTPSNPWLPYIGECPALDKYLKSKDGVGWLIPKYLNALFRGVSQVVFANNPLAGLIILVALFFADIFVGLAATVAATTAILTAVLLRQDPSLISAGLTTYNAVLVGTITSSLWTPLYDEPLGITHWIFIILGAALSVFVTSAFATMLSSFKISLPALTIPFNLVTILIFICLMPKMPHDVHPHPNNVTQAESLALGIQNQQNTTSTLSFLNNRGLESSALKPLSRQVRTPGTDELHNELVAQNPEEGNGKAMRKRLGGGGKDDVLDWGQILTGIILSAGQVYGVNDVIGSVLIYIAIMVYSPILFMMSALGAILGTVCGIFFTPAPYEAIYIGIWGYNGILSAGSVGGLFIVLTCHSFWNAMANVVFTVLIQQALSIAFSPIHLPFFTLPFVLSTVLFLSVTTSGNQLPRVTNITFPEMHRYNYRETNRVNREEKRGHCSADEVADSENKELVLTDVKVIGDDATLVQTQVDIDGGSANGKDDGQPEDAGEP